MSESQLMSQMSLDPGAGTFGPSTRVPETQASADARHESSRREIRPRDTYNPSLIRRMFRRR
jgi:hypothetical protein